MTPFPEKITIGEKYEPAMKITDQAEADTYFERCVAHLMTYFGQTREQAEAAERINLGYYAGYYDNETRQRVERLFRCSHPIFGSIAKVGAPTPEEAFQAGQDLAAGEKCNTFHPVNSGSHMPSEYTANALQCDGEHLARVFHLTYEALAPLYKTRSKSRLDWDNVPQANKDLMVAVAKQLLVSRVVTLRADLNALIPPAPNTHPPASPAAPQSSR